MIPAWLPEVARTQRFWERWFFELDDPFEEPPLAEDLECRFDVGDGFAVVVTADKSLCAMDIALARSPAGEGVRIGWDDEAHWHPHVLRWDELEVIARACAKQDDRLSHPGLPVLVLCRFAPICEDDDESSIVSLLEAAWAGVPGVTETAVTRFIERLDHRSHGFHWRETPRGSVIEQDPDRRRSTGLYTLREEGGGEFPWDLMLSVVAAAGRNAGPAPDVRPAVRRLRTRHDLQLTVFGESGRAWQALDAVLSDAGIGRASPGGGSMTPVAGSDPLVYETTESHTYIEVRGDLDSALELVRPVIRSIGLAVRLIEIDGPQRSEISLT